MSSAKLRRPVGPMVLGLVVVAVAVTLLYQSPSFPSLSLGDVLPGRRGGTTGQADGALPDGVTVFDDPYPGVANLEPRLLQALRDAARAAVGDGVVVVVNSGWRSRGYQNQLLRQAVATYGSE